MMVIPTSTTPTRGEAGTRPPSDDLRFRALFADNARAVLGYAMRRAASPDDAADIVADTFLVVWRRLDDVPAGPDARPWLVGVARRVLANHRRGNHRRERLGGLLGAEIRRLQPPADVRTTTDELVHEALDCLGDDDRELLTLSSWERLSPQELALVFGIPPATARTRLHRARQRLRIELERLGVSPTGGGSE